MTVTSLLDFHEVPRAVQADIHAALLRDLTDYPALIAVRPAQLAMLYAIRRMENAPTLKAGVVLRNFCARMANLTTPAQAGLMLAELSRFLVVPQITQQRRVLRSDQALWNRHPRQMQAYETAHPRAVNFAQGAPVNGRRALYERAIRRIHAGVTLANEIGTELDRSTFQLRARAPGASRTRDITALDINEIMPSL